MRLLLAEDELALSKALKAILERNKYSVDAVYDGQEALDYLNAGNNYDGVILDIMMPKIDGFAACIHCQQQHHMRTQYRQIISRMVFHTHSSLFLFYRIQEDFSRFFWKEKKRSALQEYWKC